MNEKLAVMDGEAEMLSTREPAPEVGLARAPDRVASESAIDIGPFLRQEGRPPTWKDPIHSEREDLISRLRAELGFPSTPIHYTVAQTYQSRPRPARHIASWMVGLIQKVRLPG